MDNIRAIKKLSRSFHSMEDVEQAFNISFDPVIKNGEIIMFRAKIDNLYVTIQGDRLAISNSICKYYFGANYYNLSYTQLNLAITSLENLIGVSLKDAKITYFEFGIALKVLDPERIYNDWGKLGVNQRNVMFTGGKSYGIYYRNSTFRLKCYNKTHEAKREGIQLKENFIRIEKCIKPIHVNSSPRFKGNNIITLGDLCKRKTLELLRDDLVISLKKIELRNVPEEQYDLSPKELRVWGYMNHDSSRQAMHRYHFESFKADRVEYYKLQRDYRKVDQDNFIQAVIEEINKCIYM